MTPWLPTISLTSTARLRLFCFPYAGGNSQIFRDWPAGSPPEIEICPIELPGRGRRFCDTPHTEMMAMLHDLGPELWPYLDRPFALFGHSLGALMAFELARWLRAQHYPQPSHLFLSGQSAPHIQDRGPKVHTRSDADLIDHLRGYNGTPPQLLDNLELMAILLPTIRADFQLLETYRYCDQTPLHCVMNIFGGQEDNTIDPNHLQAWQLQTTANCTVELFAGDHFFIHTAQQPLLARCINVLKPLFLKQL